MNFPQVHFICLLSLVLLSRSICAISVASTPAPYTASSQSNDYPTPTSAESATPDYNNKFNYPFYSPLKQIYDPMYGPPNNHLAESFTPYNSLLSPRTPFLLHRLPSLFNSPVHPYINQLSPESNAYPSYPPSTYPTQPGFIPSQPLYEPQYPFAYPSKYPKNTYSIPSCDYSQLFSPYRASRPFLYYPQRSENPHDYAQLAIPSKFNDAQYRHQTVPPTSHSNNYSNNVPVYH